MKGKKKHPLQTLHKGRMKLGSFELEVTARNVEVSNICDTLQIVK